MGADQVGWSGWVESSDGGTHLYQHSISGLASTSCVSLATHHVISPRVNRSKIVIL